MPKRKQLDMKSEMDGVVIVYWDESRFVWRDDSINRWVATWEDWDELKARSEGHRSSLGRQGTIFKEAGVFRVHANSSPRVPPEAYEWMHGELEAPIQEGDPVVWNHEGNTYRGIVCAVTEEEAAVKMIDSTLRVARLNWLRRNDAE